MATLPRTDPTSISAIEVVTHPRWLTVCHIPEPQTGLQLKFSYRAIVAAALLGHEAGLLTASGTMSNFFWVQDDALHTAPIANAGIAGVMRARLLNVAKAIAEPVQFSAPPLAQCQQDCEAAFVCNAVIGIWPLREWDRRSLPRHPRVERLIQALAHPFRGTA